MPDDIFDAPKKVKKTTKKPSFEQLLDDESEDLFAVKKEKSDEVRVMGVWCGCGADVCSSMAWHVCVYLSE